ncbi:MAG: cupin domain-containing protein [Minwuiales bacterium]|nr:cupin domain-containing protein [Minwuiales bacterium]
MSTASTAVAEKPAAEIGDGVVHARQDDASYVPGRRDWMRYRELGVTEASNGRIRAQVTSSSQGLSEPTGWHVHLCEGQFVYVLSGWVELAFAGGKVVRVDEGDSIYIPGNTPHNEVATSDNFDLLEISVPADMGTEPCDPPA